MLTIELLKELIVNNLLTYKIVEACFLEQWPETKQKMLNSHHVSMPACYVAVLKRIRRLAKFCFVFVYLCLSLLSTNMIVRKVDIP